MSFNPLVYVEVLVNFTYNYITREKYYIYCRDGGLAENLFLEIEQPDIRAFCTLIRGRAKFYQVEKAWHLYQEVLGKGLSIDVDTYNSLIKIVNFIREASDLRWQLVEV